VLKSFFSCVGVRSRQPTSKFAPRMHRSLLLLLVVPCLAWAADEATAERAKRDLRMLRMGKRSLQMLRMGRSVPSAEDLQNYPYDDEREDQSRAPPMPRLGKNLQSLMNDEYRRYLDEEALYDITRQLWRNPPPRIGRYARDTNNAAEEAEDFPRLGLRDTLPRFGLRDEEAALEDSELPRMGLRSSEERALPMPRLGYREAEEKRAMSMLRMGKRAMSMLRMGKRDEEKRAMSMLRMGKRESPEEEKRAMSMLRMGKRAMSMLRMGKRAMSMLRMGKKSDEVQAKRAMSMLRMGKRENSEEEVKRAMSMLRMGKRDEEKRAMSMLRMGKRELENSNSQEMSKKSEA